MATVVQGSSGDAGLFTLLASLLSGKNDVYTDPEYRERVYKHGKDLEEILQNKIKTPASIEERDIYSNEYINEDYGKNRPLSDDDKLAYQKYMSALKSDPSGDFDSYPEIADDLAGNPYRERPLPELSKRDLIDALALRNSTKNPYSDEDPYNPKFMDYIGQMYSPEKEIIKHEAVNYSPKEMAERREEAYKNYRRRVAEEEAGTSKYVNTFDLDKGLTEPQDRRHASQGVTKYFKNTTSGNIYNNFEEASKAAKKGDNIVMLSGGDPWATLAQQTAEKNKYTDVELARKARENVNALYKNRKDIAKEAMQEKLNEEYKNLEKIKALGIDITAQEKVLKTIEKEKGLSDKWYKEP